MTPFSLLIKPASADCNLNCTYCFYLKKSKLYPDTKRHRMSEAVLESMIAKYMATSQPVYCFGWQGGEPTLMGIDFFRKAVDLQKNLGCQVDWWSPEKIKQRYPLYDLSGLAGGTFGPEDGHLDAYAVLMGFKAKARSLGAEYINDEVIQLTSGGGRVTAAARAGCARETGKRG